MLVAEGPTSSHGDAGEKESLGELDREWARESRDESRGTDRVVRVFVDFLLSLREGISIVRLARTTDVMGLKHQEKKGAERRRWMLASRTCDA